MRGPFVPSKITAKTSTKHDKTRGFRINKPEKNTSTFRRYLPTYHLKLTSTNNEHRTRTWHQRQSADLRPAPTTDPQGSRREGNTEKDPSNNEGRKVMADVQTGSFTAMGAMTGNPYAVAAGVVADLVYGRAQAKKGVKQQEKYLKKVRDNAVLENSYRDRQLNLRQAQIEAQAGEEKLNTKVNALKIADRMSMSAGEHGVGGASIRGLLRQSLQASANAQSSIQRNVDATQGQLAMEKLSGQAGVQSVINGVPRERIGVDPTGAIMGAASFGAKAYADDLTKRKEVASATRRESKLTIKNAPDNPFG